MRNTKRKLRLDRETIVLLTGDHLVRVAGGDTPGTSEWFTSQNGGCPTYRWFCPQKP